MNLRYKLLLTTPFILTIFFVTTNPEKLPSVALVLPFLLLFSFFVLLFNMILNKYLKRKNTGIAFLIASFFVILLALQSLGQLTVRDFIMVVALFCVAFLYIYRRAGAAPS